MFKKLSFMSFKSWVMNGFYYARFYYLAYLTKYFHTLSRNDIPRVGYQLTFHDEFNATEVDWEKWAPAEHWGNFKAPDNPYIIWKQEQTTVDYSNDYKEGVLSLTTDVNTGGDIFTEYENQTPEPQIKSGMVCSYKSFNQKYGYFEVRAKVPPHGIYNWPAFWMYSKEKWPPEIDIFEMMGKDSSYVTMTLHTPDETTKKTEIDAIFALMELKYKYRPSNVDAAIAFLRNSHTDEANSLIQDLLALRLVSSRPRRLKFPKSDFLAKDYHIYGLYWGPDKIVWYIDDIAVYVIDRFIPDVPFHVIINNAFRQYPAKQVPDSKLLPSRLFVDYVRCYRKL